MVVDLTDPEIVTPTGDTYTTSEVVTAIERRDQEQIKPDDYDIVYHWFNLTPSNQVAGWELVQEYIYAAKPKKTALSK